MPIAAHAVIDGETLFLDGLVADPETGKTYRDAIAGPRTQADALGRTLADAVLALGAKTVLDAVYSSAP